MGNEERNPKFIRKLNENFSIYIRFKYTVPQSYLKSTL
jgi:hypothetical protein